jgi:hypothetical protein
VWDELMRLGERVRHEPHFSEALSVSYETMRRTAENVRRLHERLNTIGYRFTYPAEAIAPPIPNVSECIQRLERRVGPLPLSLRAWYEIVGSVNFIGEHPDWDHEIYSDPLVVDPIDFALAEYQEWRESCQEYGSEAVGPYTVPIAPDEYHKARGEGVPQLAVAVYSIMTPNPAADAVLGEEPHHTTFVDYLRTCFKWGGFPGFERVAKPPQKDLEFLTKDLLPI